MGRKGVSKRKPSQTRPKPMTSGTANGRVSSIVAADETQPISSGKGGLNPVSDWKKKPKKG